ncbi:glycosyltransferase family 39 protein [Ectothiorhodospira sp. BSL-9]|uniref:ArnT family glycosyltransferase n=1 Tax=Ectothiorhodospira sp. BSL-9 TaxID=1442136 RepID=UPI0007B43C14|nr:glycosyltransferase family 39 protein [Ectothiorhodospira sp. BSL-9]ANB01996.1 glycosyl transferase family 39 [Ectothiorhodospira sp. BSL-9]TVQ72223.1 MAG: glycosyltransferase family 39 protein [Chromatiaceae bacterium]
MSRFADPLSPDLDQLSLRWLWVLFLAALFTGFFYNLHGFALFDLDEGAFSEATRNMLERGDFLATYLFGEPRYDKPILIYWLQALSVSALGLNEFALRLPSALASAGWMLLIWAFTRRVLDHPTALAAGIIGATTIGIVIVGRGAIADAALNLFIAGAMFAIFLHFREGGNRWVYLAFVCMGLGFLTKGPVAVVIPLAVSLIFYVLKGRWRDWLRAAFNPLGIVLFLLLVLPWYLAITWREGPGFLLGFFLEHNLQRFLEPMESHSGPLYYYLPVLLVVMLPYTTVMLRSFVELKDRFRDDLQGYLLLWFLFVLALFSLASTKLPHYIFYGITPLFILMAMHLDAVRSRFLLFLPPALLFGALLALPELVGLIKPHVDDDFILALLSDYQQHFGPLWHAFFAIATVAAVFFMFDRRMARAWRIFLLGLVMNVGVAGLLLPAAAGLQQAPIKEAGLAARDLPDTVVMWRLHNPSFNIYAQRSVERREPEVGEVAVTKQDSLERLEDYEILFSQRGVVLVRVLAW